jgi:HEAT repeat protein
MLKPGFKFFLVACLLATSIAVVVEWTMLSKAREQNQDLAHRLRDAEERPEPQQAREISTANSEQFEILRLRNQITQLRNLKSDLERLRIENARLRAFIGPEKDAAPADWMDWLSGVRTNWVKPEDVSYLVQAMTNEETSVRLEATRGLRNIGLQRIMETNLTPQIEAELRESAKGAIPSLIVTLKDPDPLVRANAAITLGFMPGDSETIIPALISALEDEQDRVSGAAAKALTRVQPDAKSAVPALLRIAASPNESRRAAAINALRFIDPDALKNGNSP